MNLDRDHQLKTERCTLRHVREDDLPHVFSASRVAGFNDGMIWDPPANTDELLKPFRDSCEAWASGKAYVFTIESHDQTFVGRISIRKTDSDGLWDIGFWTHPDQQRRGYMTEALRRVLRFGFDELSASEIEACHATWNEASQKVLVRGGLTWREHLAEGFKKRGEWVAEERLSITREEHLSRGGG